MRLTGLDMAFLCMEEVNRPMHMGALLVFDAPEPMTASRVARLLADRAAVTPQLAMSPRDTLWPPAGAQWAAHAPLHTEYHIHVHRLPGDRPHQRLRSMVAELMTAPLRSGRPPWELHVIDGLPGDRFAVLAKLHHAMVDGTGVLAIAGALLDDAPSANGRPPRAPRPRRMSAFEQLLARPLDALRDPAEAVSTLGGEIATRARRAGQMAAIASATASAVRPSSVTAPLTSLLDGTEQRQWTTVRLPADDLHRARKQTGGTFNDVLLSVVAGGLREWLGDRGDAQPADATVRALIPVSLRGRRATQTAGGNHLSGYLVDLPVGEPDPVARVEAMRTKMRRHKATGPTRGAGAFPLLAEALPPVAHRLATPLVARLAPLLFDTLVTTVPLPDIPLRLGGAALRDVTPIAPLAPGHGLSIAIAVYRGFAHIGLFTDSGLLPGAQNLDAAIHAAADDLLRVCERDRPAAVVGSVPS